MPTDQQRRAAVRQATEPPYEYGNLGLPTGGGYQFKVPGRPQYVWVVINKTEGSTVDGCLNPNGVALVPKLPVRILNEKGVRRIVDIDPGRVEGFMNGNNVPLGAARHTHEIGYGNEDFVHSKRLSPLRCRWKTGTFVEILEGEVYWQDTEWYWPTSQFDMASTISGIGSGLYAWGKVLIDPETGDISANRSADVVAPTLLTREGLAAVSNLVSGKLYLPVAGFRLVDGQAGQGAEADVVDLRFWVGFHKDAQFTQYANVTVANTATQTTLVGAGKGSMSLISNALSVQGRTIELEAAGFVSDTGTPTLQLRFKLGSTVILDTGAITLASSISNKGWRFKGTATIQTAGSSGKIFAQGFFTYNSGTVVDIVNTAQITIDLTNAQAADLTAQWGTANASNTITLSNLVVKIIN